MIRQLSGTLGQLGVSRKPVSTPQTAWWLAGGIDSANVVAAYQAIGAESYAASLVNLANPGTYDLTDGANYPTWNAETGWQTTNANQFLNTGYVPNFNVPHSMFVRFSDNTAGTNFALAGVCKDGWYFILQGRRTDGKVGYWNGQDLLISPALSAGVIGISDRSAFRNGVKELGTIPTAKVPINNNPILVFRYSIGISLLAKIQAIAIYDVALTDAQATAVTEAMNALGEEPQPETSIIPLAMAHYARMRS